MAVSGSGGGSGNAIDPEDDHAGRDVRGNVELLSHDFYDEGESAGVRGRVRNVSNRTRVVAVDVFFFGPDGEQINNNFKNDPVDPGDEWEFQVRLPGGNADAVENYELEIDAEQAV